MLKYMFLLFTLGSFFLLNTHAAQSNEDYFLSKIIKAYELQPLTPVEHSITAKVELGKALFFDPIMSGPRNTACGTCHIRSKGSVDGLPMPVGIGAMGVSEQRVSHRDAFIIPRNVLPFFNRGSAEFTSFFWDGRVQLADDGNFESPLGELLSGGFDNLLAVAATFPQVEPDEMLGRSKRRGGNKYTTHHAELVSDQVDPDNFLLRSLDVYQGLIKRILGAGSDINDYQREYRVLFEQAYPNVREYNITHIGNALSAYIAAAFELQPAPWDLYLNGNLSALTSEQKKGAIIFYGKGRCAVCHSGVQFSDFRFHSLAIPQLGVGKHGAYLDYGRAKATGLAGDRFSFRTPPLRNVTKTGPWGHNGSLTSIKQAIIHHYNPIPLLFEAQKNNAQEGALAGRLLGYRSLILKEIYSINDNDINLLTEFLFSLESDTVMNNKEALPEKVPSGMNQFLIE